MEQILAFLSSIMAAGVLGLTIVELVGVALIAVLSVLYVRWRGLKKSEDGFVDRILRSLIDKIIDIVEKSDNIASQEVIYFLNVIKEHYIIGPNKTNEKMVEYIENKQEEIKGDKQD